MAIDFVILTLLIISFIINLLALSAFWVTPGLRTTANRFTINLLIINLISCLILTPTLFLNCGASEINASSLESNTAIDALRSSANSLEFYSKAGNHQMTIRHNGKVVEQDGIILRNQYNNSNSTTTATTVETQTNGSGETIETIFKCNSIYCRELTIDERSDRIVITEIEEDNLSIITPPSVPPTEADEVLMQKLHPLSMRCWSIDMTAALGALAVLLVVGDTWCAVTDPLRYHNRISGVKSWVFIALTWVFGILFGVLSAFRVVDFESDTLLSKQRRFPTSFFNITSMNSIFGMAYAVVYFVVIILLPFGFVCGMYWRIFSEARGNGLRMRQNGSSPLLQSALNLNNHQPTYALHYSNSLCVHRHSISSASSHGGGSSSGGCSGVLQMQIDHRRNSPSCLRRDSAAKVLLPTISDDGSSDDAEVECRARQLVPVPEHSNTHADRNQNILLTLQTASGEIKRNYSARQLPLLGTSSQDLRESNRLRGIRQVHSSPNLQKYTQLRQGSRSIECGLPHLLGHEQHHIQITSRHHAHFNSPRHNPLQQGNHQHQNQEDSHVLQIPSIHTSPKAISYMSSLRHRLSNASSLFKYRDESRAARISILVVIMFLVSYLPFGFLVLLQSRLSVANFQSSTQLAIFMVLLANVSSPFIFAYRNKRVRRGVKRLIGLDLRAASLQHQCSSSVKTNGISGAQLQRNSSRVSNYSTNSCKYLTPQSSIASNYGQANLPTFTLHPNSSCSTILNFSTSKDTKSYTEPDDRLVSAIDFRATPPACPSRPKLQRGITIVEQVPVVTPKLTHKRGLFVMFFRGSSKLQICSKGVKEACEPTEV